MKRFLRTALSVLLLTGLLSVRSEANDLAGRVREHTFANGLTLLVVERHDVPTFSANITLNVGSVDETSRERGVAHLLEHMLFKGTKSLGTSNFDREKPLLAEIEKVGSELDRLRARNSQDSAALAGLEARLKRLEEERRAYDVPQEVARIYAENGGVGYNAYTSKDLTAYIISLPANRLEMWAAIESDRMKNAVLRDFYTEREVIKEERRRSYDSDPDGMLYEILLTAAYKVHPYGAPIIGWMSDLDQLSLEKTRDFHDRHYVPANTVISLVGAIDFDQAKAVVGRYFGDIPAGEPTPPVTDREPEQNGERRVTVEFDAEPKLLMAWHKPTLPDRADYAFDLIDGILGGGRTSRLYRTLVIEKQLATNVSTYGAPGSRYTNLFVIAATPRAPHSAAEVEAAIRDEVRKLAETLVAPEELDKVRNRLRVDHLRGLRENEGLAQMLSYYQSVAGDWRYLSNYDRTISTLTPDDLQAAARRYLTDRNLTVATLKRAGGGE